MTPSDISAFFDGYARAFTALDAGAICDHYQFPVQILSENGGHVYRDRAEMLADMTGFVAFYDKVGFAAAQIASFEYQPLSSIFGQAHVDWALTDRSGGRIVTFRATYTLRIDGGGDVDRPAITGILGHSEDSAWKAAGIATNW